MGPAHLVDRPARELAKSAEVINGMGFNCVLKPAAEDNRPTSEATLTLQGLRIAIPNGNDAKAPTLSFAVGRGDKSEAVIKVSAVAPDNRTICLFEVKFAPAQLTSGSRDGRRPGHETVRGTDPRLDDDGGDDEQEARVERDEANCELGARWTRLTEYAKRWSDWRETRSLSCVKDDRARMTNHVLPVIGALDIRAVTRNDLEKLVEHLDKRIAEGTLGWKVAGNGVVERDPHVWRRLLGEEARPPRAGDEPRGNVQGPERGVRKEKQYLWPSEFLALVSCPKVPLRWRRLFALAVYTYARAGELAALRWEDVSFDNMTIHIHRNVDRVRKSRKGKVTTPKNGEARRIPIEPELLPLLKTIHEESGGKGLMVPEMPSAGMLSAKLKHYLRKGGVERAELFARDELRKPITFHDLKSTGVTWAIARGDNPLKVKQRAAHKQFSTTEGYIREAENLGSSFGTVFPTLPSMVSGFPEVFRNGEPGPEILSSSAGSGWAQQDLNL
jgi:integrase